MLRTLLLPLTLAGALLLPVAPASAEIIELGKAGATPAPSCPGDPCLAVSRTTGIQSQVGKRKALYRVPANGRIVAWSVTLGKPWKKQRAFFEKNYGGEASAGITVWRPDPKRKNKNIGKAIRESPVRNLRKFFGDTVQFPLAQTLKVKKGDKVALTVPTWAPVLAVGLPNSATWRATRAADRCEDTQTQTIHRLKQVGEYRCVYKTARLTYSATLVTSPSAG